MTTHNHPTDIMRRGKTIKLLCIIAAAMTFVVASSAGMAEPKKRSVSNKATHRMKSPQYSNRIQHTRTGSGNTTSLNAKVGTKKIRLNASGCRAMILQDLDKTISMTQARPTARRSFAVTTLISMPPGISVVQAVADSVQLTLFSSGGGKAYRLLLLGGSTRTSSMTIGRSRCALGFACLLLVSLAI